MGHRPWSGIHAPAPLVFIENLPKPSNKGVETKSYKNPSQDQDTSYLPMTDGQEATKNFTHHHITTTPPLQEQLQRPEPPRSSVARSDSTSSNNNIPRSD